MGNPLLHELKTLKKSCDELLASDRQIFKDNEHFIDIAEKACYYAFYKVTSDIIKKYEEMEEKEVTEYENYLYGGKENE